MKSLSYSKVKEYLGIEKSRKRKKRKRDTGRNKERRTILRLILIATVFLGVILIIGVIGIGVMVFAYSKRLPPPGKPFSSNITQNTDIYDRNGVLLATLNNGNVNRELINLSGVNSKMKWAMLAAEDINFYTEPGIDIFGIARAGLFDLFHRGSGLQGGSTITQELVKNADLTDTQTIKRKVEELILTLEVERQYSKDQILQAYLNQISFGGDTSGIKVASEKYFGIEPSQLDLAQSTFLAGLPQAPSYYSPIYGQDPVLQDGNLASTDRAYYVLGQMLKHSNMTGVTQAQVTAAEKEITSFKFTHTFSSEKAPHFVEYVRTLLENLYGPQKVDEGGLKVYTSLNYDIQSVAQSEVDRAFSDLNKKYLFNGDDAAMVSIDPKTGEILAMVGAPTNTWDSNITTVSTGVQPGSSIKPFLYLSAFSNIGMSPTTIMPDIPISIPMYNGYTYRDAQGNPSPYAPIDFTGGYMGLVNIDKALSLSLNVPAVETLYSLSVTKFITDLKSWGYTGLSNGSSEAANLSYAIGGENVVFLDHVNAYAALANQGTQYPATSILKVNDASGKTIYQYDPATSGKQIFDSAYGYMVNKMLEHYTYLLSVGKRFVPSLFKQGYDIGGKTGTNNTYNTKTGAEQNASSLTFVGYTPDLVSGFWFGNQANENKPLLTHGAYIPEGEYLIPYWGDYMLKVLPKFPKDSFQRPSNVVVKTVCSDTGLLQNTNENGAPCPTQTAYFEKDHVPPVDNSHTTVQVCQSDPTQLATPAMVAAGQAQSKTFVIYKTFDPYFQPMLDAYMQKNMNSNNKVPTTYCTGTTGISLQINTPANNTNFNAGDQVNIDASALVINTGNTIAHIDMYFNNNQMGSLSQSQSNKSDYTGSFSIPSGTQSGTYQLTLKAYDSAGNEQDQSISITVGGGSGNGDGNPSPSPTTPVQNNSVIIITPQNGSSVQTAPHKTDLIMQLGAGIDPLHVQSAYFTITYSGLSPNISANSNAPGNWSAQYIFPKANQGYFIQGCVILNNTQTPQCSASIAVSS